MATEFNETILAKSMSAPETVRESKPELKNPSVISAFSSAVSFRNREPK
ncbi:MAG: hypothetical protein QMC36_05995 [Patescibacteria group bacterium]